MIVIHANHLVSIGHEVNIITAVLDTVFVLDPRIKVTLLPSNRKIDTILSAVRTRFQSDLVIADIIAMVFLLSLRNRKKVLCFAQDYDESYYNNALQKMLIRIIYFLTLTILRVKAIAVSDRLAALLIRRFRGNVGIVQNGVDTETFYPDPDQHLISMKEGRQAILMLSRSDRRKGFDLSRLIIAKLPADARSRLELWTVGERISDIFPEVIHRDFGYVNEESLRRIMSSADMLLYPTRHEGLPLMPLEAFACRCPVVTTVAVPYAHDSENALVSNIEDVSSLVAQTMRLMEDASLRNNITEKAFLFAKENSLSVCTDRFCQVLVGMTQVERCA